MSGQSDISAGGRMPVVFVGHGSPMNAIEDNPWSRGLRILAGKWPRPKAVLAISAHWYVPGIWLTGNEPPPTIHDFGGFPQALFDMQYPAPGDVALAERVCGLIGPARASLRHDWGLDHGTWTVLHHLLPQADVPVVQLSIDAQLHPADHLAIGRALRPLRDEGVLILGSGSITHNLRHAFASMQSGDVSAPDWAVAFDREVVKALDQRNESALVSLIETENGRMAHPTIEHYLPLLYTMAAADEADAVHYPIEGFDWGSLSMRSVVFAAAR
jgi:4,5-DOPA dioxygenase extradiol